MKKLKQLICKIFGHKWIIKDADGGLPKRAHCVRCKRSTFRIYDCAMCKGTYVKTWSDKEALNEAERDFGTIPTAERAIVCNVCYKQIMKT